MWYHFSQGLAYLKMQKSNTAVICNPHVFEIIGLCKDKLFLFTIFSRLHDFILFNIYILTALVRTFYTLRDDEAN